MRAAPDFVANVLDLLAPWGGVSARRMFSGYGLFRHGVMFALVSDDVLYFKADARNLPEFERAGMQPFTYLTRGRTVALSYWEAPSDLFDDQDTMIAWARRALDAAMRAKNPVKPRKSAAKPYRRNITKN